MGKETYYKRKRRKAGLAQSDMAKELGIDYKKYNLIENGVVKMPSKLIDKFNEIVNKGENNHKLERLSNEQVVNDFWNEMITKEKGKYKLKDKMNEFNIITFLELANLLGVSNSNLSHYLNDKKAPYDFKNRMYLFFQDELNIQPPKQTDVATKTNYKIKKNKSGRGSSKQCHNQELIDFYNNLDLETFIKEQNITPQGLAKKIGLHQDSIRRMITKQTSIPSEKTIRKLKDYIENSANYFQVDPITETEFTTTTAQTTFEDFVVEEIPVKPLEKCDKPNDIKEKYLQEIEENNVIIETYRDIIDNLTIRNRVCEEVLAVIDEIRGE